MSINVVLMNDQKLVRDGLKSLLQTWGDIQVVGESGSGRQTVQLARDLMPDVVVMNCRQHGHHALKTTRQLRHECPFAKVIIVNGSDHGSSQEAFLGAGANLVLTTRAGAEVLVNAVRKMRRESICSTVEINGSHDEPQHPRPVAGRNSNGNGVHLTNRETEVLVLVAEGLANKQIAARLNISIKTVEKHRQRVMDKLHIHDIAGLTRYAIAAGLVEATLEPG